jgi:HK97 family phage major capsid protein
MSVEYKSTDEILNTLKSLGDSGSARVTDVAKKMFELGSATTTALKELAETVKELKGLHAEDRDRLEELESRRNLPGKAPEANKGRELKALERYVRSNDATELKEMSIGGGAAAGEAMVPELIANEIVSRAYALSQLATLVRRTNSPTSDYVRLLNLLGQSAAWSSETGTRSNSDTFQLREIRPTHGELYSVIPVTNWLLQDSKFNLGQMVMDTATSQFAKSIENAILYGTGSNQPTGILNSSPVSTADGASPERNADTIQYIDATNDLADDLISLYFSLKPEYRRNAVFVMSSASLAVVRKLRDSNGAGYLWQPNLGIAVDSGDGLLLGKRVITSELLPTVGGGSPAHDAILCGDLMQAYELVEIGQMNILRDQVTVKGKTLIYLAQRFGARLVDNDACKILKA